MTIRTMIASLTLGVLGAIVVASGAQAADKIRLGTEGAYPPFNQIDADGKLIGFDIDIGRALCKKMDAECEFVTQDWDGIIPGLLARKYDAIVASMSITPEREKAVDFTAPYYSNKLQYVAAKGSKFDPSDIAGKTIGAQRATISAQYLTDNLSETISIKLYDTQENAYLDLASGRADAVLADKLVSYEWLNSEAGQGFEFIGEPIDIDDKIGIAVRKGDDLLRERLNTALAEIREDGTYKAINEKYFPFDIY